MGIGRSHKAFRANDALKRKGEGNCVALCCAGGPPEAPFSVSTITCRNYAAAPLDVRSRPCRDLQHAASWATADSLYRVKSLFET